MTVQIVIAWAEKSDPIKTGRLVQRDANWFPEFRYDWAGRAAMWKRNGSVEDEAKAKEFADREGHSVYVFPPSVKDPLQAAKILIVKFARVRA